MSSQNSSLPAKKPSAFIVMPFDESMEWVFEDVLLPVLLEAGIEAKRADSELNQANILRDIIAGLVQCDLIIAEITGLNPNVMYELGLAHGLRKNTIMLTQNLDEVPFDLKPYRINTYSSSFRDTKQLLAELTTFLSQFLEGRVVFGNPVSDFWPEPISVPAEKASNENNIADQLVPDVKELPMGVLDFQETVHESFEKLNSWVNGVSTSTSDFALTLDSRTTSLLEIEGNDSNALKRKRIVVASVSALMNQWADSLQQGLPDAKSCWESLEGSTDGFLTTLELTNDADLKGAEDFRDSILGFRSQVSNSNESLQTLLGTIKAVPRVSRDMTNASLKLERALSETLEVMEMGKAYASRVASILTNHIEAYNSVHEI